MITVSRPEQPEFDPTETLASPPQTALQFGEYDVVGELGEGGMGRVYKAVDRKLGRFVAIKVLRSTDPFECSRFRGEAEMIATLEHANIIKIFAIETTPDGRPYLVLEFVEGGSLDRELAGQPLEPRRAAEMVETLARAVQFAHEKGVIHRDLKPANILRAKDKSLKLTDFGLAKEMEVSSGMTPSNAVMGTPSYMSPEQAEGKVKQLGPATDVYGLGAILYEMLTGRPPFRGVNMVDTLEQVRWAEPAPPSRLVPRLHRDLATICLKCLQKSPGRRYQTAGELADDLRHWLNGETITARRAPTWERLARQMRRRPWEAAAVIASLLLVGLLIAGWVYTERKAAQEKVRQEQAEAEKKVRQEKEEADRKLLAAQEKNEARLRDQANRSLGALNKIRELVLDGELSRTPGLGPLHAALSAYYEELIAQGDAGFDKVELADGLVKVGELFSRTGRKNQAKAADDRAADLCRPLAATSPKARETLAQALLNRARVAYDQQDDAAAAAACSEVEKLLAPFKPAPGAPVEDPTAARQVAEALHLRGQLLNRGGELRKAEDSYRQSIAIRQRLVEPWPAELAPLPPGDRKRALAANADLGRGYGYLGDTLLDAGKFPEAEAAYWESHRIRERVLQAYPPDDRGGEALAALCQLARSWGNFASLHTRQRATGTARYFTQQSLAAHAALVEHDSVSVEYRLDLCNRLIQLAELDILAAAQSGGRRGEELRGEALRSLDQAKKEFDNPLFARGMKERKSQGAYATVTVLRCLLRAGAGADVRDDLTRAYFALNDLCKEAPGVTPEPVHMYYRVAGVTLLSELNGTKVTPDLLERRIRELREAVERMGPDSKHPDDIENFRAFRSIADNPEFKKLMGELRAKGGAKAVATAP